MAYLESIRPSGQQNPQVRQDSIEAIERTLTQLKQELRGTYLLGDQLGAWDLDLGAALGYCDLRLGKEVVDRHLLLRNYFTNLSRRDSFKKTVPPS